MNKIRLIITAFLVWKVGQEAGPWTAIAIAFSALAFEAAALAIRRGKR